MTGSEYVNVFVLIKRSLKSFKCPENLSNIYIEMRKILKRLEKIRKNNKNNLNLYNNRKVFRWNGRF